MRATYRLQLTREFPLAAAAGVSAYLARLGVSHLYSSPILAARTGSTHGYDVVDPTRLNPGLGSERDLALLRDALAARGLCIVLDVVPNHQAATAENPAWDDLLTHGRASRFASWFDVDWEWPPSSPGVVLLPVLADLRSRCLARGEIRLSCDDGRLRIRYGETSFPVEPRSLLQIISPAPGPFQDLIARLRSLPSWRCTDPALAARRVLAGDQVTTTIIERHHSSSQFRSALAEAIARFDGPDGRHRLEALLEAQPYRLVHWRRAGHDLNYRRFFEINDLIGVRVEDPAVFAATHERVLGWVTDGTIAGLRVDHVDGLLDPAAYLDTLAAALAVARPPNSARVPILIEKILGSGEALRCDWAVAGTTGYEFLNALEAVFVDPEGLGALTDWYRVTILRRRASYRSLLLAAKRSILKTSLWPDVRRLSRLLALALPGERASPRELQEAIIEVIASLTVYRTYRSRRAREDGTEDQIRIEHAVAGALRDGRAAAHAVHALSGALLGELGDDGGPRLRVVQRFQQLSGPAMAKGGEDTALYVWVPLLSLNDVGSEPDAPLDDALPRLHRLNASRASRWPGALSATTTHDTKRSADVRARLDVLSEMPHDWTALVRRWQRATRVHRTRVRGRWSPDSNLEYLLYQTLVGVWPLPARHASRDGLPAPDAREALRARVIAYALKAAREAKVHTGWVDPDEAWEAGVTRFVNALFDDAAMVREFTDVTRRIGRPGLWNALARTLVHCTAPGVPDLYQGDELWNFSLVDPDNRRPVDFSERARLLDELETRDGDRAALAAELAAWPEDDRSKLHVIRVALAARRRHPDLFAGGYRALGAVGAYARHVVAFARLAGGSLAITVVPRFTLSIAGGRAPPVGSAWRDTALLLPPTGDRLVDTVTGQAVSIPADGGPVAMRTLLAIFPVALLVPDR
jgi:(1->4)-alpha-D-glucan 1-alpha-D-glucosylmutase